MNALSDDPNVRWRTQVDMFLDELEEEEKENRLIDKVVDKLIQRISITTDFQKAIMEIHELKKALDSLGK